MVSTAIGWRCSGGSRLCSSRSRAVPCSVVASSLLRRLRRCSVGASFFFLPLPSFSLSWLSLLARVCRGVAARWRRAWECARATGARAFIAGAPSSNGGRLVIGGWGSRGDQGRELTSNGREWLCGRGAKEIGPCPGRDPLARPCHHYRGSVGEGKRHERSGRGVEKMNRRADMRGPCGSGCKRRRGGTWVWASRGLAAGPARACGPTCCCALAGLAGCWLGCEAEQA